MSLWWRLLCVHQNQLYFPLKCTTELRFPESLAVKHHEFGPIEVEGSDVCHFLAWPRKLSSKVLQTLDFCLSAERKERTAHCEALGDGGTSR